MILLREAVDRYCALRMGGYAVTTAKAHRGQLRRFESWAVAELGPDVLLAAVDDMALTRYMDRIRPPVLAPSSFNNYRQYLQMFFGYCARSGWLSLDPMRNVRPAKLRQTVRLFLTADQVLAMMRSVGPRDRFAIALSFFTALRAGDVARLTVSSIDTRRWELTTVVQKTGRFTRLPVGPGLRSELARWLEHYAEVTGGDGAGGIPAHWLLVPSMRCFAVNVHRLELGNRTTYRPDRPLHHPERIVQRGLKVLGVPTYGEGFHTLRRSSARDLHSIAVEDGHADATRVVQSLLGHKRQATTELYLGIHPENEARDRLMRSRQI